MLPLWDTQRKPGTPAVTFLLIAANVGVFIWQVWLSLTGASALDGFVNEFALVPRRLLAGWLDERQWLTVVTHVFLHGGVGHVLGNCWFLWIFGNAVEAKLGGFRFGVLYLLGGVAAAGAQVLSEPGSGLPMVGASGAISAVLGAYFVMFPLAWIVALVPWIVPVVPVPAFVFLVLWFALQAFNGFGSLVHGSAEGGVAWWAHAGGFIAGVLLVPMLVGGGARGKKSRD